MKFENLRQPGTITMGGQDKEKFSGSSQSDDWNRDTMKGRSKCNSQDQTERIYWFRQEKEIW